MIDGTKKEEAIALRREGKSYSEIRKVVPVAKSTLTEWFVNVGLSKRQKQLLTEKKKYGQRCGAAAQKAKRVRIQREIMNLAKQDIGKITKRELLLIGTCLYWAEGTKEKEYRAGSPLQFNNSDWKMVKLYCKFLTNCMSVDKSQINYELYVHETRKLDVEKIRVFWSNKLQVSPEELSRIYFKKGNIKTRRKNSGKDYVGLVRVNVKTSSSLVRKIAGWTEGICENYWEIV